MSTSAPDTRIVDALSGQKAGAEKFFAANAAADARIAELDLLRDWQFKVAEALGLTDTVEGVGHVIVVRTVEEAVEFAEHYTETALAHEQDCPVFCDGCEQYELPMSCRACNGSGCGPGTASGAYEPCGDCDGDGRDHGSGYVYVEDMQELAAENTDLVERLDSLRNAHEITLAELEAARRQLGSAVSEC